MRFAPFTPRMGLILAHDLVVTVLAVLASFYIRFEDSFIAARSDLLSVLLPAIVLYASVVYLLIGLQKSKWRFTSLPELMKIAQAATVMAITLLALDYVLLAPNLYGTFFFGKITIVLYWFVQMFFLAGPRIAYRYFRYTRTLMHAREDAAQPTLLLGRAADADVLLRAIESGAVSRVRPVGILSPSRADRSQAIRGVPVLGEFDDLERVIADLGTRGRAVTRIILTPTALAPEAKPEALLMRARRMGLSASRLPSLDESGEAPRLAPVNVEDLLLRPSVKIDYKRLEHFVQGKSVIVTGGGGSIGSEICARLVTFGVGRLLVIEHSEPALYAVMELLENNGLLDSVKLVRMGVTLGRTTKPGLKTGVCGEHGGDPESISTFYAAGLDYVSCSPFRVPVARLAAAQAVLEHGPRNVKKAPAKKVAKKVVKKAPAKRAAK